MEVVRIARTQKMLAIRGNHDDAALAAYHYRRSQPKERGSEGRIPFSYFRSFTFAEERTKVTANIFRRSIFEERMGLG